MLSPRKELVEACHCLWVVHDVFWGISLNMQRGATRSSLYLASVIYVKIRMTRLDAI
jgi:hypothetical protein